MKTRLYELERWSFGPIDDIDKRTRHKFVHGGCIYVDVQATEGSDTEDIPLYWRVTKGFESCYGITIYQYEKSFHDAPAEVLDALDKRMNLNKIRFWQESQNTRANGQLIQISSQIIDEWKNNRSLPAQLYKDFIKQYKEQLQQNESQCNT
jgi:hypothetical protein